MRLVTISVLLGLAFHAGNAGAANSVIDRLETIVAPVWQSIEIRADARLSEYTGTTTTALRVKQTVRQFRLHAQDLDLTRVTLTRGGLPVPITFAAVGENQVEIKPLSDLTPGDGYLLAIDFKNDFDTQANAYYKLRYEGRHYTFSQFEDVQARRAFPCWDEPSFKFPYQVTLTVPVADLAISNTPIERETIEGDWKTVRFLKTKPLPSYLLAIATGPFDTVAIPGLSVPGRVVVPQGKAGLAQDAVKACPPLLSALETFFGQPYPFEKLDLLAVPEYWYGAMENPGAITFKDRLLLIDPNSGSDADRENLQSTLAHELAHMWFGDLVTMQWWDDLWLNESFATWMGSKVMEQVYPEALADAQQATDVQRAYELDSLATTRAMRQPVATQAVLLQAADALAYQKGRAILQMFEMWVGPAKFRKGILAYLKTHAWGNARGQDLWSAITKASSMDVSSAMATFLEQPGVPFVSAQLRPGGTVVLSQQRYGFAGRPVPPEQLWRIPVTLKYAAEGKVRQRRVLLDKPKLELRLTSGAELSWVHPNADERGYYRWSLDSDPLDRLASARDVLSLRERMGLPYAVASQLGAGRLSGDAVLRTLERLTIDPHPRAFGAALGAIGSVWEPLVEENVREALRSWLQRALTPAYERIGTVAEPAEDLQIRLLRPELLSWMGEQARAPQVLAWARAQAHRGLADPASFDPEMQETILELAAVEGDEPLFELYRRQFETTTMLATKRSYLAALGKFRDPALTQRAMDYVLTASMSPSDLFLIPRVVAADPERRSIVWDWIVTNYGYLTQRVPAFAMSSLPFFVSGCEPARLAEAKEFFSQPQHNVPGTDRSLAQVIEEVTICSTTRERERAAVRRFIATQ